MKRTGIVIKTHRINPKTGQLEPIPRDASARLRQRPGGSKKVRVARRAVTLEDLLVFEERERAKVGRKRKGA
jgi:hypothetical protein